MASPLQGSRSAREYERVLPASSFSVNQIWSRPIRRSPAESPRIVTSWELNTSWACRGFCFWTLEQADQLSDQTGVKAGIVFIGQQDRPLGKRLDDRSDQAEPDEGT